MPKSSRTIASLPARERERFRLICRKLGKGSAPRLLKAVSKNPKILGQLPETIVANARATAKLLAIEMPAFLALAAAQPALLYLRPSTINSKLTEGAAMFGISRQAFIVATLKRPSLVTMTTSRLAGVVVDVSRLLGTDPVPLLHAFLKAPQLLTMRAETIVANVRMSTALLGLYPQQFITCAMQQPTLLFQRPAGLRANVEESARLLRITTDEFTAAALRQPSLFYRSPRTLALKGMWLRKITRACGDNPPFAELVAQYPAALTYGPGHLEARFMLADLGLSRAKTGALLVIPTRKADALLIAHIRSNAASSAEAERAIQALREKDIIKNTG